MFDGYISKKPQKEKEMKVRIKHWYNTVLSALLSMLGYGCTSSTNEFVEMYGVPVMEYGTPYADYKMMGQVTDEKGFPINNIKTSVKNVVVSDLGAVYNWGLDSTKTDASGKYMISFKGFPSNPETKLIVEDIDGEANRGEFQSDTLDIDFEKAVKVKDGDRSWNMGTYEIYQDIKMKKK